MLPSETNAQTLTAPSSPPPPPPRPKFFDFLALPQELQDKIYGYYHKSRTVTVSYNPEYDWKGTNRIRELNIAEQPGPALLLVNKKISEDVKTFRAQSSVELVICYDKDWGLKALHVICSNEPRYHALQEKVTDIYLNRLEKRTSVHGLLYAYGLIAGGFPKLKKVHTTYSAPPQVYKDYGATSETSEWKALIIDRLRAGGYDRGKAYPTVLLYLQNLVRLLEDNGKSSVEVNLCVSWMEGGQGRYSRQVSVMIRCCPPYTD